MNFPYILLALLFFGLLIFIHELGHFIVARLCGVQILEFAIGMGPKLISFRSKKSGIVYSIRLLPIGGFVSMLGENGMELAQGGNHEEMNSETEDPRKKETSVFINDTDSIPPEEEERESEPVPPDPELAKHAYCNQSVWKRILISLAGPAMNIVLGFVLMVVLVLSLGWDYAGSNQVAGFFVEYTGTEDYGFKQGDQIIGVDGESIRSLAELKELASSKTGDLFAISVRRFDDTQTNVITETLENVPLKSLLKSNALETSLSEVCGLQVNDVITKVNNVPVHTYNELYYEIMNQGYDSLRLTVLRNGEKVVLKEVIVPQVVESGVVFGNPDFQIYREEHFNFQTVMKHSFWRSCSTVKMVFDSIQGLFTRRYGMEAVSGPIGITEVITDAAKTSPLDVLNLLIVISINLGIMNLLPLPALDGGHILLYLIEVIRRKKLKPEVEGIINFVGLVLLLALAVIISIKDVISL